MEHGSLAGPKLWLKGYPRSFSAGESPQINAYIYPKDFRFLPVALLILDEGSLSQCSEKKFNAMLFSKALISIHGNWMFGLQVFRGL